MTAASLPQRLEPLDASFLLGETAAHPLHIGAICVFDAAPVRDSGGHLRFDDLAAQVDARLHLVPRLRHKAVPVPLGLGRPFWADDDRFDPRSHLRRAALPTPGTWRQLLELVADLQSRPLERSRPLWELWFIEGLENDRIAVVPRIHHALGDGASLVGLAMVVLDLTPEPVTTEPETDREICPEPPPLQRLAHAGSDTAAEVVALIRSLSDRARNPRGSVASAAGTARSLLGALRFTSPSPLTGRIGPRRQIETLEVRLEDMREIRRAYGVTLNDVVLCAVAEGIRNLLPQAALPDRPLRALVPVSMRDPAQAPGGGLLGNRVSLLLPDLAVAVADPVERLARINAEMSERKADREAHHADGVLGVARWLPPPALAAVARLLMRTQPFASVLVTNVPGPPMPLYMHGATMTGLFPYLGAIAGMGLVVAVVSYNGNLGFTFTGDPGIVADVVPAVEGAEKCISSLLAGA